MTTKQSAGRHLTHDQIAKAYASGNYEEGTNSNGSMFFDGDTLYSWGYHFFLLHKTGRKYLRNVDWYSNSTAKHQSVCTKYINTVDLVDVSLSQLKKAGIDYRAVEVIDNKYLGNAVLKYQDNYYLTGRIEDAKSGRDMFLFALQMDIVEDYLGEFTVEDAWSSLKPEYVKDAEAEGREVIFKGGFYFCEERVFRMYETDLSTLDEIIKEQKLEVLKDQYIEGSEYFAQKYIDLRDKNSNSGQLFVRGYVKDKHRYEKMLKLPKWYNVHKINGEVL